MRCTQIDVTNRDPLELTLRVKKAPMIIIVCLSIVLALTIILPVMGIGYALIYGNGPHIGFLFALGITFIIVRFLSRTILWNIHGCEHLMFGENEFTYQADYRYFKGPVRTVKRDYEPYYFFPNEGY